MRPFRILKMKYSSGSAMQSLLPHSSKSRQPSRKGKPRFQQI